MRFGKNLENDRFTNSNFGEVFGKLEKVHRARRGCFDNFVIPAAVFGCFLFGVLAYVASGDWLALPVCAAPFALLFAGIVWHLVRTRGDELRIYEHGFTYRNGNNLQACLWQDIKSCRRRERNAREMTEAEWEEFPLCAVAKKSGEIIEFEDDAPGTAEILNRFENTTEKPRRRGKI